MAGARWELITSSQLPGNTAESRGETCPAFLGRPHCPPRGWPGTSRPGALHRLPHGREVSPRSIWGPRGTGRGRGVPALTAPWGGSGHLESVSGELCVRLGDPNRRPGLHWGPLMGILETGLPGRALGLCLGPAPVHQPARGHTSGLLRCTADQKGPGATEHLVSPPPTTPDLHSVSCGGPYPGPRQQTCL